MVRAEAVQLFLDRASLHPPGVESTGHNVRAVARICERLDGLPLAITLAAGWARVLSVDEIEHRLSDRLDLLVREQEHPRHRSLRAAFAWSYQLLSPAERAVFRSLATFSGDFDLEAAETVCRERTASGNRVLHALAALVDASMLIRRSTGRYRLLESVREYAAELSREAGEHDLVARRHLDYHLAMVRRASPLFASHEAGRWLARLEVEHSNISAALAWSQANAPDALFEMATRLASFWHYRNHLEEGVRWLQAAVSRVPPEDLRMRATVLDIISSLTLELDPAMAVEYSEESVRAAVESRQSDVIVQALTGRARVAAELGDAARALTFGRRALARARELGDDQSVAWATHHLAVANLLLGRLETARRQGEIALRLAREQSNPLLTAAALISLAHAALDEEQWARARDLLVECLRLQEEHALIFPLLLASILDLLAHVAVAFDDPVRALRLGGAAEAAMLSAGRNPSRLHGRIRDEWMRRAVAMVGPRRADVLRREGGSASFDHLVRFARYIDPWRLPLKPGQDRRYVQVGHIVLTRREREMAVFVAQGRSNQEIADRLVLSRRTVEGHLDRLRHKLGVSSRAQIAAWAATAGLMQPSKSGSPGAEIR
jgi:non-specific serine/threonine protein kinase